jgi:hypothetical protein
MLSFSQFIVESSNYNNLRRDAKKMSIDDFMSKYSVEGEHIKNQQHLAPHHHFDISQLDPSEHDSWEHPDLSARGEQTVKQHIETLKSGGHLTPVIVSGTPDNKKYRPMVWDGHHRTIAAYRAGNKTIPGWFDDKTLKQIHKQQNG